MTRNVLIVARLSRERKGRETQISIEKQDDAAQRYVSESEYATVATAADSGVSGAVSPFKRPALGPWLTDPKLTRQYDELVASNLDRFGRNARDLAELRDWAEDHGKQLTILSPRLSWPPAPDDFASPIVWVVLEQLAEIELRMVKARSAGTRAFLRERQSLIGKPPFGYRIVAKDDGGKTLAPDPTLTPYLLGMVNRYLSGSSLTDICHWLDSQNVKPLRSEKWSQKTVGQLLRNKILIGRRIEKGRTALRIEPILDWAKFNALQEKLDNAPNRRGLASGDTALLTQIAVCGKCSGPMYRVRTKQGTFYRCSTNPEASGADRYASKCKNMIPLDYLDSWVSESMTGEVFGDQEVLETVTVPAIGHQDEIEQVEAELRSLDFDAPDFTEQQAGLLAERKRLVVLPAEPARTIVRRTGKTYADHWRNLDKDGRRAFLLDHGAKVYAVKDARPSIEINV